MLIKIIIILCNLFSKIRCDFKRNIQPEEYINRFIASEESIHIFKTYYDCLREQKLKIENNLHKHAIICFKNELCILKSNNCQYEKSNVKWIKEDDENDLLINFSKFSRNENFSLLIQSTDSKDAGFYYEILNNKTVISEYHITIVEKPIHYPVYEKNFQINSLDKGFDIFVEWNQWSKCRCSELKKNTYRIRLGECYLKENLNKSKNYLIFSQFKTPIRCLSQLVSRLPLDKHDYIMYSDCNSTCNARLNSNLRFEGTSFLRLPKIKIIHVNFGEIVRLDCDVNRTNQNFFLIADMNLKWKRQNDSEVYKFNLKQSMNKIFVDKMHRLTIRYVVYSDAGNYTCYYEKEVKKIVHLYVHDADLQEKIYNYASRLGCAFVLLTLVLVNLFAFLQRKLLKNKLE